jgi:hypothetical protein
MEHDFTWLSGLRAGPLAAVCGLWAIACAGSNHGGSESPPPQEQWVPSARNVAPLEIEAIDKIDVLFVIDGSGSMREEQRALGEQFPRMARALATGDVDGDGAVDFPPPGDVQFAVISSDMGLSGIEGIDQCEGRGDDGLLMPASRSRAPGCPADLPAFVRYHGGESEVDQVARDFACLAAIGTDGCGFEHPLEAVLKALWPAGDDRVTFHGTTEGNTRGHGDAANAGFSRAEAGTVPSLLVIVVIADEDDCSAADTSLFIPNPLPDEPLAMQALNLRCSLNPDYLYPVKRYQRGLPLLREGAEQLVMFAAITGVPPDRVDRAATSGVDFADADARNEFYRELLDDPRMQERAEEGTDQQGGNLVPVCESDDARAYPARRIVQVAQGFGENGAVQSICQQDFADTMTFVLQRIAHRMRNPG